MNHHRILLAVGAAFCLVFFCANCFGYSGGTGTVNDPFQISTVNDWIALTRDPNNWDQCFVLVNDIDFAGMEITPIASDTEPDEWGFQGVPFTGMFEGNSHALRNIIINQPDKDWVGLFGYINGGQIQNLEVVHVIVYGNGAVGGLAGENGYEGKITSCHVTGEVNGSGWVGGLAGENKNIITSCSVDGTVGGGSWVGGFVGRNSSIEGITSCSAMGAVMGFELVGGLVGGNYGTILSSYASSSVDGIENVGGLVGKMFSGIIFTSYAAGYVEGEKYTGGLVGRHDYGTIASSFWDVQTSGQINSAGGSGKSTVEMQTLSTFTGAGWDILGEKSDGLHDFWQMTANDYPRLAIPEWTLKGEGTSASPYIIENDTDLSKVWLRPLAQYRLNRNLDLSGISWVLPVIPRFTGVFDGQDHTIRNLVIHQTDWDYAGLFGQIESGGCIRNLGVISASIQGDSSIGGMCGYNGGDIRNCFTTVILAGGDQSRYLGGLCGSNGGVISSCYSTGQISYGESSSSIGGFCGYNTGFISACYAASPVRGVDDSGEVGGFCGNNFVATISDCFWDMEISGLSISDGGKGLTTAEMRTLSVFQNAGWGRKGWAMEDGVDYPRLAWENTGIPLIPENMDIPLAGSGTEADPYQIHTPEEFASLSWRAEIFDRHFRLMNDLDVSHFELFPIGDQAYPFIGRFDGNHHVIRNAVINLPDRNDVGLFGFIQSGGQIKNLRIENIDVKGGSYIGGLCGQMNDGAIIACHITGSVTKSSWVRSQYIGGVCGYLYRGMIRDCTSNGSIQGGNGTFYIGGLCGVNQGTVVGCSASGSVTGLDLWQVGGLCGQNSGSISNCFATGLVSVTQYFWSSGQLGGLCGRNLGTISSSYASGTVTAGEDSSELGGLCGTNYSGSTIFNCYATGDVSGGKNSYSLGGLVGWNDYGRIIHSYSSGRVTGTSSVGGFCGATYAGSDYENKGNFWNMTTSGISSSALGTGKTIDEMQTRETFADAGWDFVNAWQMQANDYPHLIWESVKPKYSGGIGTEEDPYLISTADDWRELMRDFGNWDLYYRLNADIDLTGVELVPVGNTPFPFSGIFDGNGHVVRNAVINLPDDSDVGLFGVNLGTIRHLQIVNIAVTGNYQVGGLVGVNLRWFSNEGIFLRCGTVSRCFVSGTVSGVNDSWTLGGLAGSNGGVIDHCHTAAVVISGDNSVGLGGLSGDIIYGTISNSFSESAVICGNESLTLGGLCGYGYGQIFNSYSTGPITSGDKSGYIGGLCGLAEIENIISDCYSTGRVACGPESFEIGGLCGYREVDSIINDCFWDVEASGQTTSAGGEGRTTAEMKTLGTFTGAGWDFVGETANGTDEVWRMCADGVDYPRLAWEFSRGGDFACPDGVGVEDLMMLAENWLADDPDGLAKGDATGDDKVGLEDLVILSQFWMLPGD